MAPVEVKLFNLEMLGRPLLLKYYWDHNIWGVRDGLCHPFHCTALNPEGESAEKVERESGDFPSNPQGGLREVKSFVNLFLVRCLCGKTRPLCVKRQDRQDAARLFLCCTPETAQFTNRQAGTQRSGAGRTSRSTCPHSIFSPFHSRLFLDYNSAPCFSFLNAIYYLLCIKWRGIGGNMTEHRKKLILIVVDILCVFVGKWLPLFSPPNDNMAENMISLRLYSAHLVCVNVWSLCGWIRKKDKR